MAVSYKIENEDGTVFAETNEAACYSSVQWQSFVTCKTFIHRPALTKLSQLTALAFYDEMKALGFWVDDPARVVLTKSYCYPIKQTFFDSNKTSKSWMIANVVMSRMVDEFPGIIEDLPCSPDGPAQRGQILPVSTSPLHQYFQKFPFW
jgi:hypothetical protein